MYRIFIFIYFTIIWLVNSAYSMDLMRPKLAVFPLSARNIDAMAYNENISSLMINSLERSGVVELVDRKKIEGAIEQRGLRLDTLNQATLYDLGVQAGFDFILTGTVGRNDGKLIIELNLIGTRSNKAIKSWTYRIGDSEISSKLVEISTLTIEKIRELQKIDSIPILPKQPVVIIAPSDLQTTGTSRSITLKWSQPYPENVSSYQVYRGTSSDGVFVLLSNTSTNSFTDENLELNDSFYYKIKALGKDGRESDFSTSVQGITVIVPQSPVFINVEPNLHSALLSWYQRPDQSTGKNLVPIMYRIYRSKSVALESEFKQIAQLNSDNLVYTDQQLSEGTKYYYYITALNAAGGESKRSAILELTTVGGSLNLTAESGKIRKILLSWNQHPYDKIKGYSIYRSVSKEGPFNKIGQTGSRDSTSYLDKVDSDNSTRWYQITGITKEGTETTPCNAVSATTRSIPPAPNDVIVKSGEPRRITVSWRFSGSRADEIRGYYVYRSDQEQGKFEKIAKVGENIFLYVDSFHLLKDNTSYWYSITAFNSSGIEGQLSGVFMGTTKQVPNSPEGLTAISGEVKKVSINWKPNHGTDIREYRLWRSEPNGTFSPVGTSKKSEYIVSDLNDGTVYTFSVTAIDTDGLESRLSNLISATTAHAPSRISGTRIDVKNGLKGIAWDRSSDNNIRAYYVYRKGLFGISKKIGETSDTMFFYTDKGKAELYVTAVNTDGLEGAPSLMVIIENN